MKKIAVITDLDWLEAEISQKSAQFVVESLQYLDFDLEVFFFWRDKSLFLEKYKNFDLVIPVIHWWIWESWELTELLEKLEIEYLFSGSKGHKLCLDKFQCNLEVEKLWAKIPNSHIIKNIDELWNLTFDGSFFVKPNKSWSSIDNWKFDSVWDAYNLVKKILEYDYVLVQEFVKWREITVWVAWDYDKDIEILWVMEIVTNRDFFDFEAKYKWADTREVFADLDEITKTKIEDISLYIYRYLKLKTMARIDFILVWEELYFLEVNTIPGMTEKSFIPQMVKNKYPEISFGEFLKDFF